LHPDGQHLYAVNETSTFGGQSSGSVTAFAIDAEGSLKQLNQQSSKGAAPCHITCDTSGKHVLVANYGGGSSLVLPIQSGGRLGESSSFVQHQGSSVNPKRQEGPHAHSANLDAWNRFAFVADLGIDKILVYRYDRDRGTILANDPPSTMIKPGSGPRHFTFHPSGRFAYIINEIASTITGFAYDYQAGTLRELQTISTLPGDYQGGNSTAEVVCHPSGQFLYGSNRGHNSIAAYRIDQVSGQLSLVGIQSQGISVPRNFNVDPTGRYVVVANQSGDNLLLFGVDPESGALQPTEEQVEIGSPVCVKFLLR
jgi:6-phosphogluconolactonase